MDKLYGAKDDAEFTGLVEAAIADENAVLMEEKAALAQQLSAEKERRETRERELSLTAQTLQEKEKALVEKEETLREKENAIGVLEQQRSQDSQKIRETVEQVLKEEKERQAVEARSEQLRREKTAAERQVLRTAKIASVAVGVLVVLLFEVVIHSVTRWDWLLNHPNSYGLQGCLCLMVFFTIVGTWVRPWRKVLWGVGVSGVVFVLLQILGGPAKAP